MRSAARSTTRRVAAWVVVVLLLLGLLVPVAALSFSVEVTGASMEPTLLEGDRLLLDLVGRNDIDRFDLVEAAVGGITVVKRVIGLPGDQIQITISADGTPAVLVTPAGTTTTYRVDNPPWSTHPGSVDRPCCAADGSDLGGAGPVVVPDDQFWVIGDNWGASDDSRVFGFVHADAIGARLSYRLLPWDRAGPVSDDARLVGPVSRP